MLTTYTARPLGISSAAHPPELTAKEDARCEGLEVVMDKHSVVDGGLWRQPHHHLHVGGVHHLHHSGARKG